jgi:hypothetical protein
MASIDVESLRATLAKTIAGLPPALRSCSIETLVNDVCPIFSAEDYKRAPSVPTDHPGRG